jgi:hypothetical protein
MSFSDHGTFGPIVKSESPHPLVDATLDIATCAEEIVDLWQELRAVSGKSEHARLMRGVIHKQLNLLEPRLERLIGRYRHAYYASVARRLTGAGSVS